MLFKDILKLTFCSLAEYLFWETRKVMVFGRAIIDRLWWTNYKCQETPAKKKWKKIIQKADRVCTEIFLTHSAKVQQVP